jgi:autotransporter passenger strand-loop-strand repeat protein
MEMGMVSTWDGGTGNWGTSGDWSGGLPDSANASAMIVTTGSYAVTIGPGQAYAINSLLFNNASGTLDLDGTLDLEGFKPLINVIAGTLSLSGLLTGGLIEIQDSAELIDNGGSFGGALHLAAGAVLNLNNRSLTLGGTQTLLGDIAGGGTLDIAGTGFTGGLYLAGGVTELVSGLAIQQSSMVLNYNESSLAAIITITTAGTYAICDGSGDDLLYGTAAIFNSGLITQFDYQGNDLISINGFTQSASGEIDVAGGEMTFDEPGNAYDSLAGRLAGPGELAFEAGGTTTIYAAPGLVLDVATLNLGVDDFVLGGDLYDNGALFDEGNFGDSTIALNGHNLTLGGEALFDVAFGSATIAGPGTAAITGVAFDLTALDSGGIVLTGGAVLDDAATFVVDSNVSLGVSATDFSRLTIGASAVLEIDDNAGLISQGTAIAENSGYVIKLGSDDLSTITPTFFNIGTINILDGALAFSSLTNMGVVAVAAGSTFEAEGTLEGAGIVELAGNATAVFESRVMGGTVMLGGASAVLEIAAPSDFKAIVRSFSSGDTIDLTGVVADGFTDTNGVITLTETPFGGHASTIGILTLVGVQTSEIGLLSDGQGGTNIEFGGGTLVPVGSVATDNLIATVSSNWNNANDWSGGVPGQLSYAALSGSHALAITYDNSGTIVSVLGSNTKLIFLQTGGELALLEGGAFDGVVEQQRGILEDIGGTLDLNAGGLIGGALSGPGAFILDGGTFTLASTGTLESAVLGLDTTLALAGNANYAGAGNFSGEINLAGHNLNLFGLDTLANLIVTDSGSLVLAGTAILDDVVLTNRAALIITGTVGGEGDPPTPMIELGDSNSDMSSMTIAAGGVFNLLDNTGIMANGTAAIVNDGVMNKVAQPSDFRTSVIEAAFTNASTGTLVVTLGTLEFSGGGTFDGLIEGAAAIELTGGSYTFETGSHLDIAALEVIPSYFSPVTVALAGNFSYGGEMLAENGKANLALNGDTLTLSGVADLQNTTVESAGEIIFSGDGELGDDIFGGAARLLVSGDIKQTGEEQFGTTVTDTTTTTIAVQGTYNIVSDSGIGLDGSAVITNDGLFEKTAGFGESSVYARIIDTGTGTIDGAAGELVFLGGGIIGGTLTGAGQVTFDSDMNAETVTFVSGAAVDVASLFFDSVSATISVNMTDTGWFTASNSGELSLDGNVFTLAGQSELYDNVEGPGTLDVTGTAYVDFNLTSGAALVATGTVYVEGGQLNSASLLSGGHEVIESGATATGTVIHRGGLQIISAGGTSSASIVGSGGEEGVAPGGFTSNADVHAEGTELIAGIAVGLVVSHGGSATVYSGGLATGTLLSGGTETVSTGATASATIIYSGGEVIISSGGMAHVTTVGNGGLEYVEAGGVESGARVHSSGTEAIYGRAAGITVNAGGLATVYAHGVASGTLLSGGRQVVNGGGVASGSNIGDGGSQSVSSGGLVVSTVIHSGSKNVVSSGAIARFTIVGSGASETILDGGVVSGASVHKLGTESIFGAAFGIAVSGAATIYSGGVVSGSIIADGGIESVSSGGVVVSTTIHSGSENVVSSGAIARFTVVGSGASETILADGVVSGASVHALGTESIYGAAFGIAVSGAATVYSGGVMSNASIFGGTLEIASGGITSGSIGFSGTGGSLDLESPILPTTVISGFAVGDTIALAGIAFVSGASVTVGTAGVVTILDGGHSYNLNIAGAIVGEMDFQFSSGSLLTKFSAPAVMSFVAPAPARHAPVQVTEMDAVTRAEIANLFARVIPQAPARPDGATEPALRGKVDYGLLQGIYSSALGVPVVKAAFQHGVKIIVNEGF